MENEKKLKKFCTIGLIAFIVFYVGWFILQNATGVAPAGTTAAKVTLGTVDETPKTGFFWRMPFCSKVIFVNTRQQTGEYQAEIIKTRDLQSVGLVCSVIYQVQSDKVPELVKNVDPEKIEETILFPRVANALQETIGKNDVYLLVTQQEMVREATRYILADQLETDGYLAVKDILFYKPTFTPQFEETVEKRMSEAQKLEIAKLQTLKVEEEAKQALLLASVDIDVLKQKSKILTNPLIIKYEATKALRNWNGNTPSTLVLPSNSGLMPVLPLQSK